MEQFSFVVERWRRLYKVNVEITYKSNVVIRFKIHAGDKWILAEKWLFRKTHQWKMIRQNFKVEGNTKEHNQVMHEIIKNIEYHLNPTLPKGPHPKNDFDIKF